MTIINYCTLMIGILGVIYGMFEMITKKTPWKEDEKYTEESQSKLATVEGLIVVVAGLSLAGMGLSSNGAVLEESMYNIFLGVLIGCAALDMLAGKAIKKEK